MNETILYDLIVNKVDSIFTIKNEKTKSMQRLNRPSWVIVLKYEGETVYMYLAGNIRAFIILPFPFLKNIFV